MKFIRSSSLRSLTLLDVQRAPHDESIRSVDSQSSTIPVVDGNDLNKQRHTRHVSFDLVPTDMIRPNSPSSSSKHVRFAAAADMIMIHASPYPYVAPTRLWYSNADYLAFKHATSELVQHYGDRPWFHYLGGVHRDFRQDDDDKNNNGKNNKHYYRSSLSLQQKQRQQEKRFAVEALYLGLENYIVPTGRRARRQYLMLSMDRIQQKQHSMDDNVDTQARRQMQIQEASCRQSRVSIRWAAYMARRVAASVRQEQDEES